MKKIFLLLLTTICFISSYAQNDKYIYSYAIWGAKLECVHYFELTDKKVPDILDHVIKDSVGKTILFKNEMEFVNLLTDAGWELFQVVYSPTQYASNHRYYFRKKQSEFTEQELQKIIPNYK